MDTIFFDGVDIRDYHAYIFAQNAYDAPERVYTAQSVPGRNGALLMDMGRYENVTVQYAAIMMDGFREQADHLRNMLLSRIGYKRLEDTYHPDEYYIAALRGAVKIATTDRYDAGKMIISFERKPQRYLKSGENALLFDASGMIVNPEAMTALPLIRVYGNGTVTVNGTTFTLENNAETYTDVDCDIQEAYRGSVNCNGNLTLSTGDFPALASGENAITLGAGISKIEITPRWWRL